MSYSLKTKKEVVRQVRQGMKIVRATQIYGINRNTIWRWVKDPEKYLREPRHPARQKDLSLHRLSAKMREQERLFAVYSSQGRKPANTGTGTVPGEEVYAMSAVDDKDTKQHIRDLKKENEYLRARVAYLEALMELTGTPVPELKKKRSTRPSTKSSETGSEQ